MHDIGIIAIGPIVTEPESDTQPGKISIEVLTRLMAKTLLKCRQS